jgi:formate C-acetyltransferase
MGNDDDFADGIGAALLSAFAEALDGVTNERGGCYRAGTGSAMYYVTHAREVGAGADGRLHGGYLPANYSPSLGIKLNGPVSIVNSFTKPDLAAVINGGPLTLEFAATAVRDETGIGKLALLVQNFIRRGGHQLQLNVIDKRSLLDARLHPENYRNLVVRVWGWSGYFTELDEVYQEQIIKRADLSV